MVLKQLSFKIRLASRSLLLSSLKTICCEAMVSIHKCNVRSLNRSDFESKIELSPITSASLSF